MLVRVEGCDRCVAAVYAALLAFSGTIASATCSSSDDGGGGGGKETVPIVLQPILNGGGVHTQTGVGIYERARTQGIQDVE